MKAEVLIERNSEKIGGVAVFPGTRVPIEFLFQFLEDDQTLETFLDQFPTVTRAQARGVLCASRDLLLNREVTVQVKTSNTRPRRSSPASSGSN
jgi:uncharacterized protein (DUF433 family)